MMDRWKKKDSNYCQDWNIRHLVAALGRGEKRRRKSQIARKRERHQIEPHHPSRENLFLKYMADETGFKMFNGKKRDPSVIVALRFF